MIRLLSVLASVNILSACDIVEAPKPSSGGAVAGCMTRAYDDIGGPFELIDQTGQVRTEADFMDKPTLIYFGFTYCPDVCPSTLVAVNQAYNRLPDGVSPPNTLLISVDPERDTPEALASYVSSDAFPDNLVGLTGSPQAIADAADKFIVDFQRIEVPESLGAYTMDHTSLLYLMDENWQLQTFFTETESNPGRMAECLAKHLD